MTKKFKFRLETVLKLKKYNSKSEKDSLLKILNAKLENETQIENKQNYYNSISTVNKGCFLAADFQTNYYHKQQIKSEISTLRTEQNNLLEIEEVQRIKLNQAKKEEKALDKLKEKKTLSYMEDINLEENKLMDEIAQNRHKKSNNFE